MDKRTYESWKQMRYRCLNIAHPLYSRYGGAGISCSPRYLGKDGFGNFVADVGWCPGKDYSLDRVDNSQGYFPGNLRWATYKEQRANRYDSFTELEEAAMLAMRKVGKTQSEIAAALNRDQSTISKRLKLHNFVVP